MFSPSSENAAWNLNINYLNPKTKRINTQLWIGWKSKAAVVLLGVLHVMYVLISCIGGTWLLISSEYKEIVFCGVIGGN